MTVSAEMKPEPVNTRSRESGWLGRVHLASEEGVYGLILVAGLIAVSNSYGRGTARTLGLMLITVAVFWAAHVYASTVADHTGSGEKGRSLGRAVRHAIWRSQGLLTAMIPPAVPLVLSLFGLIDTRTANWIALWVIVAVLAVLGFLAYSRKKAPVYQRLIAAASTATFGVLIILAKAYLPH